MSRTDATVDFGLGRFRRLAATASTIIRCAGPACSCHARIRRLPRWLLRPGWLSRVARWQALIVEDWTLHRPATTRDQKSSSRKGPSLFAEDRIFSEHSQLRSAPHLEPSWKRRAQSRRRCPQRRSRRCRHGPLAAHRRRRDESDADGFARRRSHARRLARSARTTARTLQRYRQAYRPRPNEWQRARHQLGGRQCKHSRPSSKPGIPADRVEPPSPKRLRAISVLQAVCRSRSINPSISFRAFDDYSMAKRTYRYFDGEPLYPFRFRPELHVVRVQPAARRSRECFRQGRRHHFRRSEEHRLRGRRRGGAVYLTHPGVHGAPLRALQGFQRVHLDRGEKKTVKFVLRDRELSIVDESGKHRIVPRQSRRMDRRRPAHNDRKPRQVVLASPRNLQSRAKPLCRTDIRLGVFYPLITRNKCFKIPLAIWRNSSTLSLRLLLLYRLWICKAVARSNLRPFFTSESGRNS